MSANFVSLSSSRVYLDFLKLVLDKNTLDAEKEDALASALLLPDVYGQANRRFRICIPTLRFPPISLACACRLSSDAGLIGHALFKRRKWRLKKFTMVDFLEGGTLQAADEQTRRMFWKWLWRNARLIAAA